MKHEINELLEAEDTVKYRKAQRKRWFWDTCDEDHHICHDKEDDKLQTNRGFSSTRSYEYYLTLRQLIFLLFLTNAWNFMQPLKLKFVLTEAVFNLQRI